MAIQLQLRRGTTAENNAFTGAVGEMSYDTDTNGLRIHDGSTQGGFQVDTVVEFQAPTAGNNYTWAKKYASGWVEQGGLIPFSTTSITFPVTMADTNYCFNLGFVSTLTNNTTWEDVAVKTISTTGFTCASFSTVQRRWQVSGMAA